MKFLFVYIVYILYLKMKYYLPILLFSFLGLVSCRNDTHTLNIIQVSGLLYEKTAQQDVMLTITETNITKIAPSSIKHAAIKEEGNTNIYPVNLVCADKKVLNPYSFVKCKIDLSNVPQGLYKIILLIHGSEHYIINNRGSDLQILTKIHHPSYV